MKVAASVQEYFEKRLQSTNFVCLLLPPANQVCEGYVFTPVSQSFCSREAGGMRGGGVHGGGMRGGERVWQGGMQEGHVWQGGMHGEGMCSGGACMAGGMRMRGHACHAWPPPGHYEIRSVNERAVRILLGYILVISCTLCNRAFHIRINADLNGR